MLLISTSWTKGLGISSALRPDAEAATSSATAAAHLKRAQYRIRTTPSTCDGIGGGPTPRPNGTRVHRFGDCLTVDEDGSTVPADLHRKLADRLTPDSRWLPRATVRRGRADVSSVSLCIGPGFITGAPFLDLGPGDLGHVPRCARIRASMRLAVRRLIRANAFDDRRGPRDISRRGFAMPGARRLHRVDRVDHDGLPRAAGAPRPKLAQPHRRRSPFDPGAGRRATSPPRSDRPRKVAAKNAAKALRPACSSRNPGSPAKTMSFCDIIIGRSYSCGRFCQITGRRFLPAPRRGSQGRERRRQVRRQARR